MISEKRNSSVITLTDTKDLFDLSIGNRVKKKILYYLIIKSKKEKTMITINNTPQRGINPIGEYPHYSGVIIKSFKYGKYFNEWLDNRKTKFKYYLNKNKNKINYHSKENVSIIDQWKYKYPIILFVENPENNDEFIFEGYFDIDVVDGKVINKKESLNLIKRYSKLGIPKSMTWLEEIIIAFEELDGVAHYSDLYRYIKNNTKRKLPKSWKAIIRREIENHSSDSEVFLGKEDIFQAIGGLGNGIWGLREYSDRNQMPLDIEEPRFPKRKKIETTRIIRDTKLGKYLKRLYNNKCQICGKSIKLKKKFYSEAHHLKPLGKKHNGFDNIDNILILCPNHHAEFDYCSIAINPKTSQIIHIDEKNEFHGKRIYFSKSHKITKENIVYHYKRFLE